MRQFKGQVQMWLGGMGVVLLLGMVCLGSSAPELLIHTDPHDFLLKESDLSGLGSYSIPSHESYAISNDMILYLLGDPGGAERLSITGRVNGWRAHYVADGAGGPRHITEIVTQYGSARGARKNLDRYLLAVVDPANWKPLDTTLNLGDAEVVEMRRETYASGETRVSLAVNFTYRNIGVRLEGVGAEGEVRLEDLNALARVVLARLGAVEAESGPVPAPTPGFEAPEEGRMIYR